MVRARLPIIQERPLTRGECVDGIRPCPYVTCRHHLLLEVGNDGRMWRSHEFNEKDEDSIVAALVAMPETCSLDVADRESNGDMSVGLTQEQVGELLRLTQKSVSVIEDAAIDKVRVLVADEHPDDPYFAAVLRWQLKKST